MAEITRSEAFEIATKYNAKERMGARIGEVLLQNELGREPSLYDGPPLQDCWIAYVEPENILSWGLRESLIILIDRRDGSIRYSGGAADEG
jgi:hypothetical protein